MNEIYTDGACIGNPGPGGWGAVVVRDGETEDFSGSEPRTTNNRMEIAAVIRGLEKVPKHEPVTVHSDSTYVINTVTKGWQRKANQDLWAELDRALAGRNVRWEWVRGHRGSQLNERAHSLANGAARELTEGARAAKAGVLTHLDESGEARMVDVGAKEVTERTAVATGAVVMRPETLRLIREGGFEKGDVLGVARTAGIMAAKRTHDLIPLCHPIPITHLSVEFDADGADDRVNVTATARARWSTGVEMEALTAVAVAALTVYDMCKSADRAMRIEGVRLLRKTGGRSGDFTADD